MLGGAFPDVISVFPDDRVALREVSRPRRTG